MAVPQGAELFSRRHHNDILHVLRCLNGDFLRDTECYFGGGTAIVLELGEYRESVDIDFLCASQEGYRKLRHPSTGRDGSREGEHPSGRAVEPERAHRWRMAHRLLAREARLNSDSRAGVGRWHRHNKQHAGALGGHEESREAAHRRLVA